MTVTPPRRKKYIRENTGLFLCVLFVAGTAIAAACALSKPWDAPVSETFRVRDVHPVSGAPNTPHRGVDMDKPDDTDCGDVIQIAKDGCTVEKYTSYGGYGNTLIRDCGNNVKEVFAHLQSFNTPVDTVQVGDSGGATSCHLHYEVIVDGISVDPECVWGTGANCPSSLGSGGTKQANLCDAEQREALKQDAQAKLNGYAGSPIVVGGTAQPGSTPTYTGDGTAGGNTGRPAGYTGRSTDTGMDVTVGGVDIGGNQGGAGQSSSGGGSAGTAQQQAVQQSAAEKAAAAVQAAVASNPPPTTTTGSSGEGKPSSCAVDTWNAMVNQAVLQARREDVINKTYIVKPDSVLHYACFEQALKGVENKGAAVLSESEHWKGLTVDISGRSAENPKPKTITTNYSMGQQSMDMALNSTVRAIMTPYLTQNFNHTMLGGTSDIAAPAAGATTCDMMKKVWKVAQCRNFDKNATVFPKFEEMIGTADPRKFPPDMVCDETGITQRMIDIAQNKDFTQISKAKSYKEYLQETSCALTINTGVTVHRREAQGDRSQVVKYKDGACINPGCNYGKSGKCE